MSSNTKSLQEQIEVALKTTNEKIMKKLVHSPYMNVRRALARNSQLPHALMDILAKDPVLNVSYMAIKSRRSSFKKEFLNVHPCVSCDVMESSLQCQQCTKKDEHRV